MEGEAIDLFETPDKLPKKVQKVLLKYENDNTSFKICRKLLKELKPLGYTFEYGLDAMPYELRKIKTKSKKL
jgi:hypothetical protein